MPDLKNPRLIYAKGILFLVCGTLSASILLANSMRWQTAVLLMLTVWSFCRFYYFAFYVIQYYVDDNYRFSGLLDFAKHCWRSRRSGGKAAPRTSGAIEKPGI